MKRKLGIVGAVVLLIFATLVLISPWANAARLNRLAQPSRIIVTPRGSVEVAEEGSGPAVLVLHGTPGGFDAGLLVAREAFPKATHLIAVSRAGYLRTPLGLARTPEAQADLYAAMLAQMGIERAVVFAFSGGGPFGLAFAERHPQRCRGLILAAALSRRFNEQPDWMPNAFRALDVIAWWVPLLGPDRGGWGMYRALTPAGPRVNGWRNDLAALAHLPEEFQGRIYRPTLILHGTADQQASPAQSAELERRIPGAKFIAVPGATHTSLFESAAAKQAIEAFLR